MGETYDILLEGAKVIFVAGIPLIAVCAAAGVLGSLVQSFFSIQDPVINYALKLGGVVVVGGVLSATVISAVEGLALRAFAP